jgi:hypothetical protein
MWDILMVSNPGGSYEMAFNRWGFIYLGLGDEDPAVDRAVIDRGGLRTTIVAVPDKATAVRVAVELVDGGAQSIELCGAFGSVTTAQVIQAVGNRALVGSVSYGAESIPALTALFPPPAPGS